MFPNQSPYSYSFNNPLSFKDPSGLAPEKEKGNRNQIQDMNWFERLKESWKQYNLEYQIQFGRQMLWEKEGNSIFWNDQYNDLIRRANSIDIGIDYSVELAKRARQGRLGVGSAGGGNGVIREFTDWSIEGFLTFFSEEITRIKELQKETGIEWGFVVIWDYKNKVMRASEFIKGKEKGIWQTIDGDKVNDALDLNGTEVVLGFFHSHPDDSKLENQFSPGDLGNLDKLFEGFTDLPLPQDKSILFMGLVTPTQIQVLRVGDVEQFKTFNDNFYDRQKDTQQNWYYHPDKLFSPQQFYHKKR